MVFSYTVSSETWIVSQGHLCVPEGLLNEASDKGEEGNLVSSGWSLPTPGPPAPPHRSPAVPPCSEPACRPPRSRWTMSVRESQSERVSETLSWRVSIWQRRFQPTKDCTTLANRQVDKALQNTLPIPDSLRPVWVVLIIISIAVSSIHYQINMC